MNDTDGIRLQKRGPVSAAEEGWIDILRAIAPEGVPRPSLRVVQALRLAMKADAECKTSRAANGGDVGGGKSRKVH